MNKNIVISTTLIGGFGFVSFLLVFCVDVYIVSSTSMMPTFVPGDIVACADFSNIARGDLVAFEAPLDRSIGIKRVVGTPKDVIAYAGKELRVNDVVMTKHLVEKLPPDNPGDLLLEQVLFDQTISIQESYFDGSPGANVVLDHSYFLLGDNRDESVDSRHFGPVGVESISCEIVATMASERENGLSFARTRVF